MLPADGSSGATAKTTTPEVSDAQLIHDMKVQALQIGNIAGDVKRHDLPPAGRHGGIAAGEAFKDETHDGRAVAFADDVVMRVEHLDGRPQLGERALLRLRRVADGLELAKQRQQVSAFHRMVLGQCLGEIEPKQTA